MLQDSKSRDDLDILKNKINDISAFFKNTLSSTDNKPLVGWFCTYTPEELIVAGGFIPVRIFGRKKIIKSESYFPINFCPYIKSSWESLLSCTDNFKAVIFTNSCDGMRRFFDTANIYLKDTPSYLLDVPHLREAGSIDFFANNLNNMKRFIENLKCKKISNKEIKNAVSLINKKRRLLKKYSQISTKLPELISISSYFKVMELSMISAPEIFTDDLERYIKFIREVNAENMTNLQPNYKNTPGIMIIGNFITEEKLWGMLSTMNLKLASDDLCISSRYFEKNVKLSGDSDFLNLTAERYLNKPQCMRMADPGLKLKEIENNIIKNNIEGVIFISLKFCDTMLYSFPLLKQKLNELGIPTLYLEIEYNNFSEGQLKTRIQAFLEML